MNDKIMRVRLKEPHKKTLYFETMREAYNYLALYIPLEIWHKCDIKKLNWFQRLISIF